jgi:uncharacterized phage protein (TIGR02218 family)
MSLKQQVITAFDGRAKVKTGLVAYPGDEISFSAAGVFRGFIFSQFYAYPEGTYDPTNEPHVEYSPEQVNDYPFKGKGADKFKYEFLKPFSLAIMVGDEDNYTQVEQGSRTGSFIVTGGGGDIWIDFNSYKDKKYKPQNKMEVKIVRETEDDNSAVPLPPHTVSPTRFVPSGLQRKKSSDAFKSAYFWFVQPRYGPAEAYTSWDAKLDCPSYENEFGLAGNLTPAMTYKSNRGMDVTAIPTSVKNDIKAPDVQAIRLDNEKLLSGYYEGAYIEIFEADPDGSRNQRTLYVVGELGNSNVTDHIATVEVTPITEWISRPIGARIQVICDVGRLPGETFGRKRCWNEITKDGPNILDWTRGAITIGTFSTAKLVFGPVVVEGFNGFEDGFPGSHGRLIGVTGKNAGVVRDIGTFDATTGDCVLRRSLPYVPLIGDRFKVEAGCDGSHEMCKNLWNNLKNRRAFDNVPGRGAARRQYRAA